MRKKTLLFIVFMFASVHFLSAQIQIKGTIKDTSNAPLPGANILEKGTTNGGSSDLDGKFSLSVDTNATLIISFSGFETQEIAVNGKTNFNIVLKEGLELDEVVITGSRTPTRSNTTSALPIDIVSSKDLQSTGQATFDKALQYKIPSFNTVQTPVNDATSLLDPYEIRNMGPSRTLILINGKRKNLSALLYTQDSPGRGETGADISAIPTDAIKSIQILRDGASAQYGSDAIAGVMNVILKDNYNGGSATFRAGITSEGDGEMLGVSVNNGTSIGDSGKGFINYTVDFSKTTLANRPGMVSAEGEAVEFGADIADVREFLSRNPDANNINGAPETTASKFLINGSYDLTENSNLYFNAAYVYKNVNSFANYRTPYWKSVVTEPYLADLFPGSHPTNAGGFDGYVPTFEGVLNDFNATLGFKAKKNGWNSDISVTFGGNKQSYAVNNSHNSSYTLTDPVWDDANNNGQVDPGEAVFNNNKYRENSPTSFNPGGTAFNHVVGNIDISRILSDNVSIAFGSEFRSEVFEIIAGSTASYEGGGSDSFAGNNPINSGSFNRYNLGGYVSLDWDINKDFLISGTARAENYSDFGSTFVWKISSRYKFADDKYTIRGSVSTGFRAPTLHQIYTEKAQYSFADDGGIEINGLVNNVSPTAKALGIPKLRPEESTNVTVGFGAKPMRNVSFTVDYYKIDVDDRIVYTNPINNNQFFVNGFSTTTSGLDFVASFNRIELGAGKLGFNLSGNYTIENERTSDLPQFDGQDVLDRANLALMFTSRPKTKWILGTNYNVNKWDFSLNNTYFGKTTFKQKFMSDDLRTEFIPKIVTDLAINYRFTDKISIALNVNNILNVIPEWEFKAENANGQSIIDDTTITSSGLTQIQNEANAITFNNRYAITTYDGSHFSQLGTMFNLSVNYQF
ncbi:TonB-dependent receptor [Tenacibaculum sp. AHE15PA]|uniref:TonB-dependent receptor n=1 Tax=unclassified Tenacibaculum TaxID=2635139 RepID=UPI001C4E5591|nr:MULTISPECIES: TonB-dependent receptor [unclassified Tenacibaculum]QXP73640.1 TonB-dependent receptor [Tenacibaculum sp. AHE14PA]QXP75991.1 TonB-dependent receptor [Tenacibaculum sp. AHE15PA]